MNKHVHYFLLIIFSISLTQCSDDEKPVKQYHEGVVIVNEGAFTAGNGSVTFYDPASEKASQNIFVNDIGDFAGDVAQSLTLSGDRAYLVLNGDNKIEVLNSTTFRSVQTITDALIDKPRYVEVIGDKAYISVWGAYDEFFSLIDSYVLVYDLTTKAVVKTIDTDEGTENLLYTSNRLFASNFNYGSSNTVSVINPETNTLIDNVELEAGPAGMVTDANGKVWIVCVGGWGAETGQLFRINPTTLEVEEEITITGVPGMDIAATPDGQNIVYTVGTSVYGISISATEEPESELFEADEITSVYALNIDSDTGNIYIGDAPSFTAPGKVYVYTASGATLTSFSAGIGPGQIAFKVD